MNPDDFESCYLCGYDGCDGCMQSDEYWAEVEIYKQDPANLACCCGSD